MCKYTKNQKKSLQNNEYFQKIMTVEQSSDSLFTPIALQQTIKKSAKTPLSSKYASPFANKYAPQQSNVIRKSMSGNFQKGPKRKPPDIDELLVTQYLDNILALLSYAGQSITDDISGIRQAAIQKVIKDTGYHPNYVRRALDNKWVLDNTEELLRQRNAELNLSSDTSASADVPSSATTTTSIAPDASSLPTTSESTSSLLPTTSESTSSFNPFEVPPTAPKPPSAASKMVEQLMRLPSDIKNSKAFKRIMRELQRLPTDIERGNALPRLLNALSASQRREDAEVGRNLATILRNPLGEFSGTSILQPQLPIVTAKQLEEDPNLRNPFNRPGYVSDFLGNTRARFSNPYLQDAQYFFEHYLNDPRARNVREIGKLGTKASIAYGLGKLAIPPLYNLALNAYDAYNAYANEPEKKPENNNQTNTPSSTVTQQDVQSMKPILPKYPDKYYELANQIAIQDVAENFNRQFFGEKGKGQLLFDQPLRDNYVRLMLTLFPDEQSKLMQTTQQMVNDLSPFWNQKTSKNTVNPYEGNAENNYVLSRIKDLKYERLQEQLKNFQEKELPNIRLNNIYLTDDDEVKILTSKLNELKNKYDEKDYIKDASKALSELQHKTLRYMYDTMAQDVYPMAEENFDRGRKYDSRAWYNPARWISPKQDQEYFIPYGEKDKKILQNTKLVHFNTQPQPPEYFESLFTKTPRYPKVPENQYKYPGKPNDIPTAYPGIIQKRASKKQSHNAIQKSLAPKYQSISRNKYLKEK